MFSFSLNEESLTSEHILVENEKLSEIEIKSLESFDEVKQVFRVYQRIGKKRSPFIITNKIVLKVLDKSNINAIETLYNLKRVDKKWLGENVYILSAPEGTEEKQILETANQIYESGLVEFAHPVFSMCNNELGGTNDDLANSVMTDGNGFVRIGGDFRDEVDFDPGLDSEMHDSNGNEDAYLMVLPTNCD